VLGPVVLESMVGFLDIVGTSVGNMGSFSLISTFDHLLPGDVLFSFLVSDSEDWIALIHSSLLQMLDDFVDVTKDEKLMMHMWNSFVRKQR
jgi:uncharacterized membrane protein